MAAGPEIKVAPPSVQPTERSGVYLQPGEVFASAEPTRITTILGSCVAVCLWDPDTAVGGMNHYLMPYRIRRAEANDRFGVVAIPILIERLTELGAYRSRLSAKVFGGACVIGNRQREDHLGLQNARLALELLDQEGITVVAQDVGGTRGRKLLFHTDEGSAWVKLL
jgi:chemotaxis protein CheD